MPLSPTAYYYASDHQRHLLNLDSGYFAVSLLPNKPAVLNDKGENLLPADVLAALSGEGVATDQIRYATDGDYFLVPIPTTLSVPALPKQSTEPLLRALFDRLITKRNSIYLAPVFHAEDGNTIVLGRTFEADFDPALSEDALKLRLDSLDSAAVPFHCMDDNSKSSKGGTTNDPPINVAPPVPLCSVQAYRWRTRNGFAALEQTNAFAESGQALTVSLSLLSGVRYFSTQSYFADSITMDYYPSSSPYSYYQFWWLDSQWGVNAPSAWGITPGSPGIVVGVLDGGTGFHDDLLLVRTLNNSGWGYRTNVWPPTQDGQTDSNYTHGTQVAGMINGKNNRPTFDNSLVGGIAPASPVFGLRVKDGDQEPAAFNAYLLAQMNGLRVTNISMDLPNIMGMTRTAMRQTQATGTPHFASSGNGDHPPYDGYGSLNSISHIPSLYAVGATGRSGHRVLTFTGNSSLESTFGIGIAFAAPGDEIKTTDYQGNYGEWTSTAGTSFSSPITAAIAALTLSANPALNSDDVFQIMRDSATYVTESASPYTTNSMSNPNPTWNIQTGYGIPNAGKAVRLASNYIPADMSVGPDGSRWILSPGFEQRLGYPAVAGARVTVMDTYGRVRYAFRLGQPVSEPSAYYTTTPSRTWFARQIAVGGDGNARILWVNENPTGGSSGYKELVQICTPYGQGGANYLPNSYNGAVRTLAFTVDHNNNLFTVEQKALTTSQAADGTQYLRKYGSPSNGVYPMTGYETIASSFYSTQDTTSTQGTSLLIVASSIAVNPTTNEVSVLMNYLASGQYIVRTFTQYCAHVRDFYTPTSGGSGDQSVGKYDPFTVAATGLKVGSDGTHYVLFTTTSGEITSDVQYQTRVLGVVPDPQPGFPKNGKVVYDSYLQPTEFTPAGVNASDQHSPVFDIHFSTDYRGYPQFWESPKALAIVPDGITGVPGNRPLVLWNRITPPATAESPVTGYALPQTFVQELNAKAELPSGQFYFMSGDPTHTFEVVKESYSYNALDTTVSSLSYGAVYWNASALPATTGQTSVLTREALPGRDGAGYICYGPYATNLAPGRHRVGWNLQLADTPPALPTSGSRVLYGGQLVHLQVADDEAGVLLGSKMVYAGEFGDNNVHEFNVEFDLPASSVGHHLEFRAYWYANAHLYLTEVHVSGGYQWSATDTAIGHSGGSQDGNDWRLTGSSGLTYGPNVANVTPGNRQATYQLQIENDNGYWASNQQVCVVNVHDNTANSELDVFGLTLQDFGGYSTWRTFRRPFALPASLAGHQLEFRVFKTGGPPLKVRAVGMDDIQ